MAAPTGQPRPPRRRILRSGALRGLLLLAPVLLWIAIFFVVPLAGMLRQSVYQDGWTLAAYSTFFSTDLYLSIIRRTFEIALLTTLAALVLSYPVAYFLVVGKSRLKLLLLLVVTLPYMLDYIVRTYSWIILMGRRGLINETLIRIGLIDEPLRLLNSLPAVLIGMVQVMMPLMILMLYSAMLRIDLRLPMAARIHGASPWNAFRTVFLPLSLPGVYGACLLVFVLSLGFYITPALLGGVRETMISQTIYFLGAELLDWPLASAAAAVLLFAALVIVVLYNTFFSLDRLWGGEK